MFDKKAQVLQQIYIISKEIRQQVQASITKDYLKVTANILLLECFHSFHSVTSKSKNKDDSNKSSRYNRHPLSFT